MATTSRNEPCPCGSGKKYKHCHLNKPADIKSPKLWIPLLLCLLAIGIGIFFGVTRTPGAGLAVSGGALMIVGILWVVRRPPPPKGGKNDPGAINFGS